MRVFCARDFRRSKVLLMDECGTLTAALSPVEGPIYLEFFILGAGGKDCTGRV